MCFTVIIAVLLILSPIVIITLSIQVLTKSYTFTNIISNQTKYTGIIDSIEVTIDIYNAQYLNGFLVNTTLISNMSYRQPISANMLGQDINSLIVPGGNSNLTALKSANILVNNISIPVPFSFIITYSIDYYYNFPESIWTITPRDNIIECWASTPFGDKIYGAPLPCEQSIVTTHTNHFYNFAIAGVVVGAVWLAMVLLPPFLWKSIYKLFALIIEEINENITLRKTIVYRQIRRLIILIINLFKFLSESEI